MEHCPQLSFDVFTSTPLHVSRCAPSASAGHAPDSLRLRATARIPQVQGGDLQGRGCDQSRRTSVRRRLRETVQRGEAVWWHNIVF